MFYRIVNVLTTPLLIEREKALTYSLIEIKIFSSRSKDLKDEGQRGFFSFEERLNNGAGEERKVNYG